MKIMNQAANHNERHERSAITATVAGILISGPLPFLLGLKMWPKQPLTVDTVSDVTMRMLLPLNTQTMANIGLVMIAAGCLALISSATAAKGKTGAENRRHTPTFGRWMAIMVVLYIAMTNTSLLNMAIAKNFPHRSFNASLR